MKVAVLGFVVIATLFSFGAADDLAVMGMIQVTHDSTGYGYGTFQTQSSPTSPGFSVEYRHWWAREGKWRDHGIVISYALASTGAGFSTPYASINFGLQRHMFDVGYVHRFRSDNVVSPYVMGGAGGTITDGGAVPGGTLGIDGQFDLMAETGADLRTGRHFGLRCGLATHWFRAPNFSDAGYHAARTQMFEPRVGLMWKF